MTTSRPAVLWDLVAAHAAAGGRSVSVADVCAVAEAKASGAWVAATSRGGPDFVMCVSDPVAERLAEISLMLGEGPCHDVLATTAPVLAADMGDAESGRRWPAFTPEARAAGVAAVFVFPLVIGAIQAGVLGLYRVSPGPLDGPQLGDCLLLADGATMLLLNSLERSPDGADDGRGLDGQPSALAVHRAEIDQATGMLTVQLGVSAGQAFARLRAYAYVEDLRLADVARDIVARRLRLYPDPSQDGGQ
jgi:ANTAR domain